MRISFRAFVSLLIGQFYYRLTRDERGVFASRDYWLGLESAVVAAVADTDSAEANRLEI